MSFQIDSSRSLRAHDQLVELVRAVLAASPNDESRSVEWKSSYDEITGSSASFAISRAILGLANRPVSVAATAFEGVGYIVVGAEPGTLHGQSVPDSAELVNALRRYTGHSFPIWDPRTVAVDDVDVLVITVEPPHDGDRIVLLQNDYQPPKDRLIPEGTIFIRRPGASERASRLELEMLQDRLIAGLAGPDAALRAGRNDRIRALVSAAVSAAQRWADTMEVITIATASGQGQKFDWIEWMNIDSGKQMVADAQTVKDSTRELRLLVKDAALLEPLAVAFKAFTSPEAFDGVHRSPSTEEARTTAYRQINLIKRAWATVETAAVELLAE